MTLHLPSRRAVLVAVALALLVLVVVFWHVLVALSAAGAVIWFTHRRRGRLGRPSGHRHGLAVRGLEAAGIAGGSLAGWRGLRAEARRREELHAARLETEQARAAELRSRTEHRKRTRAEQEKAERSAYWQGAIDGKG